MAFMKPREYPIRKANTKDRTVGQVHNPPRYPERGGFTDASKLDTGSPLMDLEPPTSSRPATKGVKAPN